MTVRTRFAPSPTGSLHLGSARTALFAWAYARHHQGEFILRIEDTDRERSEQRFVDMIIEGMDWLGLDLDEGPIFQTNRFDRYREVMQQLLDSGHAYRCTCTKDRLTELREQQLALKQKPCYDGHCRESNLTGDCTEPFVVRFRNPQEGEVSFEDNVKGRITVSNAELDDLILWRSDDTPTYNFTVVVDDMDMKISHVIRGDDHVNNTPRQINIFKALGATVPEYAHIPMILGPDMKKLSKRHGALSILEYRDEGILSDALVNYLARLGWSHGDEEIFSRQAFIDWFELSTLNNSPAAFNPEKLIWLNQHYLQFGDEERNCEALKAHFDQAGLDINNGPKLSDLLGALAARCKTLKDVVEKSRYFYQDFEHYDEQAEKKHLTSEALSVLKVMRTKLDSTTWEKDDLKQCIADVMASLSLKMGQVAQPLRVALTGNTNSPSIDDTLLLIGKNRCLERLDKAISHLS